MRAAWNQFVAQSKNGTFLFDRDYMDYHADRFADFSLMVFRRGRLYALLPANADGETLVSHGGLTYGGLVMGSRVTAADSLVMFGAINDYLRAAGFRRVVYRPVPWIYQRQPAEEDLYALFRVCNARHTAREISSCIVQTSKLPWYRIRLSGAKQAAAAGISIAESDDYAAFWQMLADNLRVKYGLRPVHTQEELELLHGRFPAQIRLWMAYDAQRVPVGGSVVYLTPQVAHSQYIASTPDGKRLHALDLLFDELINRALTDVPFFDFGKSTEEHGEELNEQLIYQKEGFGARGICYDTYEWTL